LYVARGLLRHDMWQRRLSHLPIHKQKPSLQEQAAPYNAHCRQDTQMFEAQPNCCGTDGEDTEQDQAIDPTHTALQGVWYNTEAIATHAVTLGLRAAELLGLGTSQPGVVSALAKEEVFHSSSSICEERRARWKQLMSLW
jgi:hypothetical protein